MICKTVRYNRALGLLNELLNCSPLSEKNAKHARKYRAELRAQSELAGFLAGASSQFEFGDKNCAFRVSCTDADRPTISSPEDSWLEYNRVFTS